MTRKLSVVQPAEPPRTLTAADLSTLEDLLAGVERRSVVLTHNLEGLAAKAPPAALSTALAGLAYETEQACAAIAAILWPTKGGA